MTSLIKQAYTYTAVKDVIVHKVKKFYVYDVESSLRGIEEYDMGGEITTRVMSLETYNNKKRDQ